MIRPLLEVKNISKTYGKQVVIDDLSFVIAENQKIALIGRNGAGKSTVFNIITGVEEADRGVVNTFGITKMGKISQSEILPSDISALTFLEQQSGCPSWTIKKMAAEFGLTSRDLDLAPSALSGGYQMRVKIVRMLLEDPNLLLLDEPVNYLDLPTILLLERFLKSYKGSFILIAHDREFLQNTCTTTFEIERGALTIYSGTVQEYLDWKVEQAEYKKNTNKKLKREISHHQAFVDRFKFKASQASRAQSKMKHIAKLRHKLAEIDAAIATTRITITSPAAVAGVALRVQDLAIGYGGRIIAENISAEFIRGEKILIAGENGRGKSTFLKSITGVIPPIAGSVKWWHHADIGYYDQMMEKNLFPNETVLDHLVRMAPGHVSGERVLMMAGNFLFRDDDLEKKTSVLSGGERARLSLAGVLLHEHNVLVLDEPTNHLDVETAEALAIALKNYKGTVIFVSHARTFVNALVDRIFEVRGGSLRQYMGLYEDYVNDMNELLEETVAEIESEEGATSSPSVDRAERRIRLKELTRSQARLDHAMKKLDTERSEILKFYFEYPTEYAPEKATRLAEMNEEFERLEHDWLVHQEKIDALK